VRTHVEHGGVAAGASADPSFPPPQASIYEEGRRAWALAADQLPLEHMN
jgi:hypothetical protein